MEKLDLFKQYRHEYRASKTPILVETGPARYLAIEGRGAPGSDGFQAAIAALYGMAFTIKMTHKFAGRGDYVVAKLSGRYWTDVGDDLARVPKDEWLWEMMIRTPTSIGEDARDAAIETLKGKGKLGDFDAVRLIDLEEGRCVQMLHLGPYEKENESIAEMRAFVEEQGLGLHMHHHEIYLNDPRRIPPERLKTILRHPVK